MKRMLCLLAVVILLPMVANASEPRTHIEEMTAKFVAAFNAGDSVTVASLYSEDAAIFPPGGMRIDGRSAIQTFWQGAIDSGLKIDGIHIGDITPGNGIVGDVGTLDLIVPSDSGPTKVSGKYIVIWKRTGHTWQLHRDIWNLN